MRAYMLLYSIFCCGRLDIRLSRKKSKNVKEITKSILTAPCIIAVFIGTYFYMD